MSEQLASQQSPIASQQSKTVVRRKWQSPNAAEWRSLEPLAKRQRIEEALSRGLSWRQAAHSLGISPGALAGVMNRAKHPHQPKTPRARHAFPPRYFSIHPAEHQELLSLYLTGVPRKAIAYQFECSMETVRKTVKRIMESQNAS